MTGTRFSTLDPGDPEQVAEYERDFYRAYAGLTDNTLVRTIWEWDDLGGRLRTRIPYRNQVVYCRRGQTGRLAGAMAVNLMPEKDFQAAAFGFAAPSVVGSPNARECEILTVMSGQDGQRWSLPVYTDFIREHCYRDLVSRGFDTAYSTCTRRRLRPYLRLGAELLNRECIDGEERFFLRWPLGNG